LQRPEESLAMILTAQRAKATQNTGYSQVIVVAWRHPIGSTQIELI
jgi:hypothetical protein